MQDHLFDAQKRFYGCSARKKLFLGGRQSGKTETLAVEALEEAGNYGKSVYWVTSTEQMAQEAARKIRDFTNLKDISQSLKADIKSFKRTELRFNSGGRILFTSLGRGERFIGEDLIILDDASMLKEEAYDTIDVAMKTPTETYQWLASATPECGEYMRKVENYGFKTIPVPTRANPMVDEEFLQNMIGTMGREKATKTFLLGHNINDHLIVDYDDGDERIYECVLCDLEVAPSLEEPDENLATMEAWTYGMAENESCC